MTDQPTLIQTSTPAPPKVFERHVQAVATELRKRWGPCDHYECEDDDMCHVTMVREILDLSASLASASLDVLARAPEDVTVLLAEPTDAFQVADRHADDQVLIGVRLQAVAIAMAARKGRGGMSGADVDEAIADARRIVWFAYEPEGRT